jgi:predicted glycoside hydrolase/deacetylase ChbG (UPF0249 family)
LRKLIVNADDLGHSGEVNEGVFEAHDRGIVTSASLMVRGAGAESAAALARERPRLSLGLHVDLGEWSYREPEGWTALREVAPHLVSREVDDQAKRFVALVGRSPTHVDSHQHVHLREPARSAVLGLGGRLNVPVRHFDAGVRYCGSFYGQTETGEPLPDSITSDALARLVSSLLPGTTELCCHPGKGNVRGTSYASERVRELAALCDPAVRASLEDAGVRLCSFGDLA